MQDGQTSTISVYILANKQNLAYENQLQDWRDKCPYIEKLSNTSSEHAQ